MRVIETRYCTPVVSVFSSAADSTIVKPDAPDPCVTGEAMLFCPGDARPQTIVVGFDVRTTLRLKTFPPLHEY